MEGLYFKIKGILEGCSMNIIRNRGVSVQEEWTHQADGSSEQKTIL